MSNINQKSNSTIWTRRIIVTGGILLILFSIVVAVRQIVNRRAIDQEIEKLNAEIARLKVDQKGLLDELDVYQSDFFLEKQARTKLNLKKEGEKVVVVRLTDPGGQTRDGNVDTQAQKTNLGVWREYFFGEKNN